LIGANVRRLPARIRPHWGRTVGPWSPCSVPPADRDAVVEEGECLLAFLTDGADTAIGGVSITAA
jgi:hypothetical protein